MTGADGVPVSHEELCARAARYRALTESLDEGYLLVQVLFDEQGRAIDLYCIESNPAAVRMQRADFTGRRLRASAPSVDRFWIEIGAQVVGTGVGVRRQHYAAAIDTWFDFFAFRIGDPTAHQVAVLFQDVTEKKRAELSLRASETRYRTLVSSMPGGAVFVVDHDHTYRIADGEAIRTMGWNATTFIGRSVTEVVGPALADEYRAHYTRALSGDSFEIEHDVRGRTFVTRGAPLRDEHGNIVAALAVAHDISDRRRAEAALRATEVQLRDALHAAELARYETERSNRLLNDFFARASHELRGPLAAMRMWLEQLQVDDPALRSRAIDAIEQSVQRQTRLVSDLLDMARGLAGKLRVEREPVDLALAVETTLDDFESQARQQSISLQFDAPDEPLCVLGDLERLQQAVANVIANAIKYSRRGGRVRVVLAREGAMALVRVQDEGKGIGPSFLPHVFTPYQQEDSSLTRTHGGLGLGLAIVKQIVELHGGSVYAASEGEGRGATFTLAFPSIDDGHVVEGRTTARVALSRDALQGARILLVDDDGLLRSGLAGVLSDHGAVVADVGSADDASILLARESFDVLVCDLAMPGRDGHSLVRDLRAEADSPNHAVAAVALSGQVRDEDRAMAFAAGFQVHLAKPVATNELVSTLAALATRGPLRT